MKLAFVTIFDARDVRNWSGTLLHMWKALEGQGIEVEIIDNLRHGPSVGRRLRKVWSTRVQRRDFLHFWDVDTARDYATDVAERLSRLNGVDAVLSPSPVPLAFLDCPQPKIMWTDADFAGLSRMYAEFDPALISGFAAKSARAIDRGAVERCDMLIYAADYSARCAIEYGGADPRKVHVVPYGANISAPHNAADIAAMAVARGNTPIKLLFVGVDWKRKGAAKAIEMTRLLRERGVDAELQLVGCSPPPGEMLPKFVRPLGFISKSTPEGQDRLFQLYREAHLLVVPSMAEAYGLVFAEASAFGVPSLSHRIGGIPTIVKDDVNGRLFDVAQPVSEWADWAAPLLRDRSRYTALARRSFEEYKTRLNWESAGRSAAALLGRVVPTPSNRFASSGGGPAAGVQESCAAS